MFNKAVPIWIRGKETLLNGSCVFFAEFGKHQNAELKITASNFYKAYLNGKLLSFGPSRAAHGYFRIDRLPLDNLEEKNTLYIEVAGYNALSYWAIDQSAFLQAEVEADNKTVIWTGEHFYAREYTQKIRKVARFSYQRAFVESYKFTESFSDISKTIHYKEFIPAQEVKGGKIIERGARYPKYDIVTSCDIENGKCRLTDCPPLLQIQMIEKGLKIYPMDEWESDPSGYISRLEYQKTQIGEGIKGEEYKLFDFNVSQTGFIELSCVANEPSHVFVVFEELNVNTDSGSTVQCSPFSGQLEL